MKNLYTAIAAIMSFTVVASAEDDPRGKPIVEPAASASASATPAPAPAAAPAAAPAPVPTAETLPNGQPKPADYGECIEQLATSITDGANLNKQLEDCTAKVVRLEGKKPTVKAPDRPKAETPKPPRQPRQFKCEGDGIAPSGLDCACDDEEAVAVVKSPGTKTCVPRYAAFLLLKKRVAALEERPDFKGAVDALSVRIDQLSTLEGERFNTLYASIQLILGDMEKVKKQLEDHERRIGAIEAHEPVQDAAIADADRKAEEAKRKAEEAKEAAAAAGRSRPSLSFTGLGAFDFQGDRGADGRYGVLAGLEYPFAPTSPVAGVIEGGAFHAPFHGEYTFGDSVVGTLAGGVRIHTTDSHALGVDVGVTYNTWLMTHSAGYLGMPSQFVASNFGPHLGLRANFSRQFHGLVRCGVGFGPENHLSGSNIAKEHPAQPWCGLGGGITFGLSKE